MPFYRKSYRPRRGGEEPEKCADPAKARARALDALSAREMTSTQLYERLGARFTEQAAAAAVAEMVRKLGETFSPVELVVNNAGVSGQGLFQDTTDEMWDRYLAVNLSGARNTVKAALPHMISEKRGCIVNISSIWGQRGASCEVAYSCTKAGIIALTRSLAMELAPSGIRVNCVAPGVINTDMVQVLGQETVEELIRETPLGRLGTPEDIAYAVAFFASERAGFITGQVLTADGGFIV